MTVTHTGSTRKYSENWERIFGKSGQKTVRRAAKGSASAGKKKKSAPARKSKGSKKARKR